MSAYYLLIINYKLILTTRWITSILGFILNSQLELIYALEKYKPELRIPCFKKLALAINLMVLAHIVF